MVVGRSVKTGALGIALSLIGAFWVSRSLSTLLFGIDPTDPIIFLGVALGALVLALLASYLPTRRIASVHPDSVLQAE
jgi:ABC-type lipoprotein release transport system permease subunit